MKRKQRPRDPGKPLSQAVTLFFFLAFLLLFVKNCYLHGFGTAIAEHWQGLALAIAVPMLNMVTTGLLPRLFPADKLLLSLTNFLCALGVLVLYCTNPKYAYSQALYYFIGLIAMVACIYIVRIIRSFRLLAWPMMLASLALLALPLLIGEETYGATNWFYVGGVSVQPSEVVKLCLVIVLARFMADQRFWPWLIFSAACLGVLMLQKDLGTALLYFGTTLLLYYTASGNLLITGLGAAAGAGAAVVGYRMFAHVRRRVAVWLDPWQDYNDAGYQIIQSLMAIASGGLFGVGLGLGSPTTIPVYHTDFIFAVICEQFGLIFGLCVLLVYVAIIWRGAAAARAARTRFHGLLAMGCATLLGLQTFVIIGGVLKLIPLTGVTMPFVSYGGTSLVSSLCLIGLLQGVVSLNEDAIREDCRLANYTE